MLLCSIQLLFVSQILVYLCCCFVCVPCFDCIVLLLLVVCTAHLNRHHNCARNHIFFPSLTPSVSALSTPPHLYVLTTTSATVVGVERSVGPEGITQCTAYVINENNRPPREVTRTITIRPRDSGRPVDPNMPPTYDQAVTGKDKSVKVNPEGTQSSTTGPGPDGGPPVYGELGQRNPAQVRPSAPAYDVAPSMESLASVVCDSDEVSPPAYSRNPRTSISSSISDDSVTARLLA